MQLDDGEGVDVLGVLYLPGRGHSGLVQKPVVILGAAPVLAAEQVAAAHQGHLEIVLHGIDAAVGGERAVGDEEDVVLEQALPDDSGSGVLELVDHDEIIHDASSHPPVGVTQRLEIFCISLVTAGLAYGDGVETLLHRSVTDIQGGMGRQDADLDLLCVISLKIVKTTPRSNIWSP